MVEKPEYSPRLSFVAEWFHEEAGIVRTYTVCFYLADNAIEVFDGKTKKTFLRRTKMSDLHERDFYVGSKIDVFGRQFDIVDYGDELTKLTLAKYRKKTFVILKTTVVAQLGKILCAFIDSGFAINKGQMVHFTSEQVNGFLGEANKGDVEISILMNQLVAGPTIGFELTSDNAVEKLLRCQSQQTKSEKAINEGGGDNNMNAAVAGNDIFLPSSLLALFEREEMRNGIYCSKTDEQAARNINFFFESKMLPRCVLKNSTLAVIKPHCIKEGNLGKIISEITNNGFKITGLRINLLERVNCEEFYDVYRGVVPEYIGMVSQLTSGVHMALEIVCEDETKNAHAQFRELCGPMDPEIAKLLRPHTLRAVFGTTKIMNAVHCTDLQEDTVLELQYLFQIL